VDPSAEAMTPAIQERSSLLQHLVILRHLLLEIKWKIVCSINHKFSPVSAQIHIRCPLCSATTTNVQGAGRDPPSAPNYVGKLLKLEIRDFLFTKLDRQFRFCDNTGLQESPICMALKIIFPMI
jgi:hypothetical protein